jgi:hypothetical protein
VLPLQRELPQLVASQRQPPDYERRNLPPLWLSLSLPPLRSCYLLPRALLSLPSPTWLVPLTSRHYPELLAMLRERYQSTAFHLSFLSGQNTITNRTMVNRAKKIALSASTSSPTAHHDFYAVN